MPHSRHISQAYAYGQIQEQLEDLLSGATRGEIRMIAAALVFHARNLLLDQLRANEQEWLELVALPKDQEGQP
jgi:hypothetical protein